MPSPLDLADLPFLREALLELVLLAVTGGVLGAWIVLRRLAFFSHAAGSATFPGLVVADASGVTPMIAGIAVALGYAGGVQRAGAGRDHGEATALLLVAALATGVILASDVFESGAVVDRLLFGTLLGLDTADVVLSAVVAVLATAGALALGRTWSAVGFDPDGARALGLSTGRADLLLLALVAVAAVAAIPAVGALLVTAIYVLPAAAARMLTASIRGLVACALARRPRGGRGGPLPGLLARRARRSPRGRARSARVPRDRGGHPQADGMSEPAVTVEQLAAGYGGVPVLEHVSLEARPGQSVCVLGPNGGGKTTLFRVLLGELEPTAGRVELSGRPAYMAQTERTRLDFPVTALDVALMGTLAAGRWWLPPRRAERDAAAAALDRVGLADAAGIRFGELSGGQRQRALLARALVQDARVLLLDEPLSGVDPASATLIDGVFDELRAEGRTLLVASHDVESARSFDLVLCLNGHQVAFGRPADILTRATLEATYGHELIVLEDSAPTRAVTIQHHEHGH